MQTNRDINNPHKELVDQLISDPRTGSRTRLIAIQKEDYAPEMFFEQRLLGAGQSYSHECDNIPEASLMKRESNYRGPEGEVRATQILDSRTEGLRQPGI